MPLRTGWGVSSREYPYTRGVAQGGLSEQKNAPKTAGGGERRHRVRR